MLRDIAVTVVLMILIREWPEISAWTRHRDLELSQSDFTPMTLPKLDRQLLVDGCRIILLTPRNVHVYIQSVLALACQWELLAFLLPPHTLQMVILAWPWHLVPSCWFHFLSNSEMSITFCLLEVRFITAWAWGLEFDSTLYISLSYT